MMQRDRLESSLLECLNFEEEEEKENQQKQKRNFFFS